MSKQLKPNEWIYFFDLYEKNFHLFKFEYEIRRQKSFRENLKTHFLKKYRDYKYNNSIDVLKSNTGKAPKKGKGVGRKMKKRKKADSSHLNKDDIDNLLDLLIRISDEKGNEKIKEEVNKIIKKSQTSCRKWSACGFGSKSTISRIKNEPVKEKNNLNEIDEMIRKTFFRLNQTRGRRPIWAEIVNQNPKIKISASTVGRSLLKQGLKTKTRTRYKNKAKELKDTKVQIPDYVKRDFNNLNHQELIIASDVTYLKSPIDVLHQNHIFLSVAISHRTKKVINFNISLHNDLDLVMQHIKNIETNTKTIIHTDHGLQYSSEHFRFMCREKGWIQSMSRIGNSLDNREIEHFFGILKTEFLYHHEYWKWTFNELKEKISEFIHYYNYLRIQEKLNWLSPNEFAKANNI